MDHQVSLSLAWIRAAGVLGFLGVALGAFGAHGLRGRVSPDLLEIFRTGVLYHLLHAVALLALALAGGRLRAGRAVAWLWTCGIAVFSGSLYLLTFTGARWLGAVTPAGGLALMAGWATLVVAGLAATDDRSA